MTSKLSLLFWIGVLIGVLLIVFMSDIVVGDYSATLVPW